MAAMAAAAPMPASMAAVARGPISAVEVELELLIATGTHRTPRCVATGVTAASLPSVNDIPSGRLIATFTPAGVLTTARPSNKSPVINPSVKRKTIFDPGLSSTRPNLPRLTIARLPFEQATPIRLLLNIVAPVMALLSLTVADPETINWPTN
jgi:hypothetical protein